MLSHSRFHIFHTKDVRNISWCTAKKLWCCIMWTHKIISYTICLLKFIWQDIEILLNVGDQKTTVIFVCNACVHKHQIYQTIFLEGLLWYLNRGKCTSDTRFNATVFNISRASETTFCWALIWKVVDNLGYNGNVFFLNWLSFPYPHKCQHIIQKYFQTMKHTLSI